MFIWALNLFGTQRSYRVRKSAVAAAVVTAVAAGIDGLEVVLFQTSGQEGELDMVTGLYYGASCCRCSGGPDTAGQAAPTTFPVSREAEPQEARLGVAGSPAVSHCSMASLLSAREGERWWGVRRGVAGNIDCSKGSALLPPSPPGGEGNMAADGLGVCPLSG
jgi:hypothetical protein